MIAYLKGTIVGSDAHACILDVGGVGYELLMSSKGLASLPPAGRECLVHTYLQVKDDSMTMFGFASLQEKEMFGRLVNVSGIGPKIALAALSTYTSQDLAGVIAEGDVAAVSRVPGVGKKTAQRVILELQGILKSDVEASNATAVPVSSALKDASLALESMGFSAEEVSAAFKGGEVEGMDVSSLVRLGLKNLGGR